MSNLVLRLTKEVRNANDGSDEAWEAAYYELQTYFKRLNSSIVRFTRKPTTQLEEYEIIICEAEAVVRCPRPRSQFLSMIQEHCRSSSNVRSDAIWIGPWTRNAFPEREDGNNALMDLNLQSVGLGGLRDRGTYLSRFTTSGLVVQYQASFEFDRQEIEILIERPNLLYRMIVKIESIFMDILVSERQGYSDMFLQLLNPVLLYKPEKDFVKKIDRLDRDKVVWKRTFEIPSFLTAETLGASTTLKLSLNREDAHRALRLFWYKEYRVFWTTLTQETSTSPTLPALNFTTFDCHWALRVLWSRGAGVQEQLAQLVDHNLLNLAGVDEAKISKAFERTADCVETNPLLSVRRALSTFCSQQLEQTDESSIPGTYMVRRIIQTPTRTLYYNPQLCFENRVLRKFESDYCVRIAYRDDDWSKMMGKEALAERAVLHHTTAGYLIHDRDFKFLACSNSQLRDHGCWLYARDPNGISAQQIRDWMGDFRDIRCVAKYISRMGQCFSHSEDTIGMSLSDGVTVELNEEDVERGLCPLTRQPYTFSDGVGLISKALSAEAQRNMRKSRDGVQGPLACALQVRYGGCKGMLVLEPRLQGRQVRFRRSMTKFHSNHERLEVMKLAKPMRLYLNRQVITLLEQLGVAESSFMRLQDQVLQNIADMLLLEEPATETLCTRANKTTALKYRTYREAGVSMTSEPFFRSLLLAVSRSILGMLSRKARIELPIKDSRNILGVMDETDTLEYGQIFLQVSTSLEQPGPPNVNVILGTVVVSKMPAHHPGDIRKLTAVDVPALHHLFDVIVFPQKGHRPHPNELSGSDLDGDEYFVTWNPNLIFSSSNQEPMNFPAAPKKQQLGPIQVHDMLDFVVDYIANDVLGVLSYAHLAFADQLPDGIFSTKCKDLAATLSLAVDFPKTGTRPPVDFKEDKPTKYPDFMQKADHYHTYKSERVLGTLYRICRSISRITSKDDDHYKSDLAAVPLDPHLVVSGKDRFLAAAEHDMMQYESKLRALLQQYGIKNEAEAISGCITQIHSRLKEREDRFETEQLVAVRLNHLVEQTRAEFFQEFGRNQAYWEVNTNSSIMAKASAWYYVCYNRNPAQFLSFPWLVGDVLAKLKTMKSLEGTSSFAASDEPTLELLEADIKSHYEAHKERSKLDIILTKCYQSRSTNCEKLVVNASDQNPEILAAMCVLLKWAEVQKIDFGTSITEQKFFALIILNWLEKNEIQTCTRIAQLDPARFRALRVHLTRNKPVAPTLRRRHSELLLSAFQMLSDSGLLLGEIRAPISLQQLLTVEEREVRFLHEKAVRSLHRLAHRPRLDTILTSYNANRSDNRDEWSQEAAQAHHDVGIFFLHAELWNILSIGSNNLALENYLMRRFGDRLREVRVRRNRHVRRRRVGILMCEGEHSAVAHIENFVTTLSANPISVLNVLGNAF